uniref:HECT-type E3 ubiquitin transferase n=1 Tax=Albugo laibachii Nc14 TaxID=890382 RepID=F0WZT3_9STRA|nr:HECT E3 ubiquitin ligase putative [Albugo laibachii Nc14]|eukprot:CCA27010.1 HECT E3 ubiquitin ligase putative [Albugo laibachii Nc14]
MDMCKCIEATRKPQLHICCSMPILQYPELQCSRICDSATIFVGRMILLSVSKLPQVSRVADIEIVPTKLPSKAMEPIPHHIASSLPSLLLLLQLLLLLLRSNYNIDLRTHVTHVLWRENSFRYDIIPRTSLAVFDYQLPLCGVPSIDVDNWPSRTYVKYHEIDQPNRREKNTAEWFWEFFSSFLQEKPARLLQFATGSSRVSVKRFKALLGSDGRVRRVGIRLVSCGTPFEGLFPQAHTCFNRIDLPIYESKEKEETYLNLVINMEIAGFSMQ